MTSCETHSHAFRLADYLLWTQAAKNPDPLVRKVLACWAERLALTYVPDQVDWRINDRAYLLVDQTAGALYGPGPWDEIDYLPGSRPMLEAVLAEEVRLAPGGRDSDKALAIMRFARDVCRGKPTQTPDLFHGGWEEEVIKKASMMCNEQTRAMIRLAQIAGLPARYVGHITGDHGCAEIKVDGAWAYFDIRGHYYFKPDGRLASIWELKQDPSLIDRQRPEVARDILPGRTRDMTRTQTHPRAVTVIAPYPFSDFSWRNYRWTPHTGALTQKLAAQAKAWETARNALLGARPGAER